MASSGAKAVLSVRIIADADSKGFKKAVREIKAFENLSLIHISEPTRRS